MYFCVCFTPLPYQLNPINGSQDLGIKIGPNTMLSAPEDKDMKDLAMMV